MQKFKNLFLVLCSLSFSIFMAVAHTQQTYNDLNDGVPIIVTRDIVYTELDRSSTIQASIDGHYLTVIFTQDIGTLAMELDKVSGPMIFSYPSVQTPDGYQFYLPLTGDYIITFTLANGDEYYGEFTVTN